MLTPFRTSCRLGRALGLLALGWAVAGLRAGPGREVWVYGAVEGRLPADWQGEFQLLEKLRDDEHKAYDYEAEATFSHALDGPWSATLGVTEVHQLSGSVWLGENRPFASLTWRELLEGWSVGVRTQVEYRDREAQPTTWRYRLRTVVAVPVPKDCRWSPYASAEGYYEKVTGRWDQTRVFFGTTCAWPPGWMADTYAGWRGDLKSARWHQTPVLGLKFTRRM